MKILILGDIVGNAGIEHLEKNLRRQVSLLGADAVIVNGENAAEIRGISPTDADRIFASGVDVITLGNHAFSSYNNVGTYLDDNQHRIIRPANYPASLPGVGHLIYDICGYRVLCMNVCGVVYSEPLGDPFDSVEKILSSESGNYDYSLLDIHAEATSEKLALARYFDGRINAIWGTHTHVQTADEQVLPNGSLYITDLGMTGPVDGILGTDSDAVIKKLRYHVPVKFSVAKGPCRSTGVLIDLSSNTIKRVSF